MTNISESTTELEYLTKVYEAMQLLKARKARSERARRYYQNNPGLKAKQHFALKAWWSNPENRRKMLLIHKSPEYRKALSEGLKRRKYKHPIEVKQKISNTMKSTHRMHSWTAEERHEWSRSMSQQQKAFWSNPENKKRMSEAIRKSKANKLKTLKKDNK